MKSRTRPCLVHDRAEYPPQLVRLRLQWRQPRLGHPCPPTDHAEPESGFVELLQGCPDTLAEVCTAERLIRHGNIRAHRRPRAVELIHYTSRAALCLDRISHHHGSVAKLIYPVNKPLLQPTHS